MSKYKNFFKVYTLFVQFKYIVNSTTTFKSIISPFLVSIVRWLVDAARKARTLCILWIFRSVAYAHAVLHKLCARAPAASGCRARKKFENLICATPRHFKSTVNRQRSYISNAYRAYAADVSAKSTAFERRAPQKLSVPVSKQLCLIKRIQWVCCATAGRTSQNNTLNCTCRGFGLNVPIIT